MDGRRQDAAPQGARRPARDPRQRRARRARWPTHGIAPIDLLVVNLYPFEATVAKGAAYDDCIENIDIGGPAMIRAAAKNHADVTVVVEPERLRRACSPSIGDARRRDHAGAAQALAAKAYARTAAYDAAIAQLVRRARSATTAPACRAFGGQLARGAALRREPAPAGGLLSRRASSAPASPPRGSCRARSCPTTTSTTPTPPSSCVAEFDPDAHRRRRHHQARQSLRRRRRRDARSRPTARRCAAIRVSASAASSRSTARSTPRRPRAITEIFTEVIIAPDATDEADRDLRRQEEPAPAARRRPARSARRRA